MLSTGAKLTGSLKQLSGYRRPLESRTRIHQSVGLVLEHIYIRDKIARMETALFKNRLVPVGVFQRQKSAPNEQATCPACGESLFVSAANSMVKTASFNHYAHPVEENHCSLSYQYHPTYSWLKNVPQELSAERAALLRHEFFQTDNLRRAFTFLTSLTGKGAVTSPVFSLLLRKADEFGIWKYSGLPVWAVPYILLTFIDFIVRPTAKPVYVLRFIVEKPPRSKLTTTWLQPGQCKLAKYFVNKGKANKLFGTVAPGKAAPVSARNPNPLTFSEEEFKRITADTSWIGDGLNHLLEEMQMEPEDEAVNGTSDAPTAASRSHAVKSAPSHTDTKRQTPRPLPTSAIALASPTHSVGPDLDALRQKSDAGVAVKAPRPANQQPTVPEIASPAARPAPPSSPFTSPPVPLSPPLPALKPLPTPQAMPTEPSSIAKVPAPLITHSGINLVSSPHREPDGESVPQPDRPGSASSATAPALEASRTGQEAHSPVPGMARNQSQPAKAVASTGSDRHSQGSGQDLGIWRWIKSLFR